MANQGFVTAVIKTTAFAGWMSALRVAHATQEEIKRMSADLARLSQWIDDRNASRAPEALTWHRVMKVAEETGEVTNAMIGWTGGNPWKGVTHGVSDVIHELLDVAISALSGVEHLTGNEGRSTDLLHDHIDYLMERAEKSGLV